MHRPSISVVASLGAATIAVGGLSACGSVIDRKPDLIAGKTAFVQKCGSCHTLSRAGTKGIQGPDLDNAFKESLSEGIRRSTVRGVVARQVQEPNRAAQVDPATGKTLIAMPKGLVKGQTLNDVAAYVSSVADKPGQDQGRLADIGKPTGAAATKEANGTINIPTNPTGQLAYQFTSATATAGPVKLISKNASSTPHDIAITGPGISQKTGKIVSGGASSEVDVTLKPGKYTFFCTVPGHRMAGMVGTITVK